MKRRVFNKRVAKVLAAAGIALSAGVYELSKPAETHMQDIYAPDYFDLETVRKLVHCENEDGYPQVVEKKAKTSQEPKTATISMSGFASAGASNAMSHVSSFFSQPSATFQKTMSNTGDSYDYVSTYGCIPERDVVETRIAKTETSMVSEVEIKDIDTTHERCNNFAHDTCERLSQHGYKMYLISIVPDDNKLAWKHDWHQFAAFKVAENEYVFIDKSNTEITHWHGSLQEFVEQYGDGTVKMTLVPFFDLGISRYTRPKYENGASRMLRDFLSTIPAEEDMEVTPFKKELPQKGMNVAMTRLR